MSRKSRISLEWSLTRVQLTAQKHGQSNYEQVLYTLGPLYAEGQEKYVENTSATVCVWEGGMGRC